MSDLVHAIVHAGCMCAGTYFRCIRQMINANQLVEIELVCLLCYTKLSLHHWPKPIPIETVAINIIICVLLKLSFTKIPVFFLFSIVRFHYGMLAIIISVGTRNTVQHTTHHFIAQFR